MAAVGTGKMSQMDPHIIYYLSFVFFICLTGQIWIVFVHMVLELAMIPGSLVAPNSRSATVQ